MLQAAEYLVERNQPLPDWRWLEMPADARVGSMNADHPVDDSFKDWQWLNAVGQWICSVKQYLHRCTRQSIRDSQEHIGWE
jgi:hypothetical protein